MAAWRKEKVDAARLSPRQKRGKGTMTEKVVIVHLLYYAGVV